MSLRTALIIGLLVQALCVLVNVWAYVAGGHHWWNVGAGVFCGVPLLRTAWIGFDAVATGLINY